MAEPKKSRTGILWATLKPKLLAWLKGKFVTAAIKKILGSAAMGGFKVWLVKYVASEFYEELIEPIFKWGIRKGLLVADLREGSVRLKKINEAKDENNADEYWDHMGGL